MNERDDRPDPDALLRQVEREEARAQQGKLRIFFGFAPGVGKTYRMLQAAREQIEAHQRDVVIGVVETHKRSDTAALVHGFETIARRQVTYRDRKLDEMDLDAVLVRKPRICLVDELAHTNAPGSRHPKRWQDVLELLEAGIDVYTTINVQHVESLNDVIAQITHVRVRETVPDALLSRADELELVDISPEELLSRLQDGKVYLSEQAERAASGFFQRGNLLALRELALRTIAQRVDVEVHAYRDQHGVSATWPTTARIMVCVGAAPSSSRLIRATCRMAASMHAPWTAAYVDQVAIQPLSAIDLERLESHLRLVDTLGGSVARLTGADVSHALLSYARKHNVTQIVVGKPTHSRLRDRLRGSLLDKLVRGSGDIDVHVIYGDEDNARAPARQRESPHAPISPARYWGALLIVACVTLLAVGLRAAFPFPDLEVLYLLGVMLTALYFGRGPSVLAAACGVAAYDFFFVHPYYTFRVSDVRYILTFALMFGIGLVVSEITARLRRQESDAVRREERTSILYALSRDLSTATEAAVAASIIARRAAELFDATTHVLMSEPGNALKPIAASPPDAQLATKELAVARYCFEHASLAGLGTDTLPGSGTICAPLSVAGSTLGVLAVVPRASTRLTLEQRELLEAYCRQAAFALERARLSAQAKEAAVRARTEEMRSSLLSAVSHDLRTPLAAITGAGTSLRFDAALDEATRKDLAESIVEEAERMERLVANLLDMTRLESGTVTLKREWVPLEELAVSALSRLSDKVGQRRVSLQFARDLPLASVDPVLVEQLFVNLIENAAKYSPASSAIEITGRKDAGLIVIEVADHGPGIPAGSEGIIFEKFVRATRQTNRTGDGVGLGLAICRAIAQAHNGAIVASNRPSGGAIFRVTLPQLSPPPSASDTHEIDP